MQLAVIVTTFDPLLHLGQMSVRLETLALALVIFGGLILAARVGRMTPAVGPYVPAPGLRPDDLVFIVIGAVPGALFGGRLGYILAHFDFYQANPSEMLNVAQGGLDLTLAVPLGILTGAGIARLIGAPVARWLHATAVPMLYVLALGKLTGILGATGQGGPSDLPWAIGFTGPGPWGSLAPAIPAHPSQVYEAILIGLGAAVLQFLSRTELVARRDGGAFFIALWLWAAGRFIVAFTWRDPTILGPFRAEQLLDLLVLAIAIGGLIERSRAPFMDATYRTGGPEEQLG